MKSMHWIVPAALVVLLSACGEEPPPQVRSEAPKKSAPIPAAPVESVQEIAEAPTEPAYDYDPAGRRDPFEPLLMVRRPIMQNEAPTTPLQTFDLGQLRLVGLIIGKGTPRAMVVAPDGKSYILEKGVAVGKNNGLVKDIRQEGVFVEERYYDFSGEVRTNIQEIALPKREGV